MLKLVVNKKGEALTMMVEGKRAMENAEKVAKFLIRYGGESDKQLGTRLRAAVQDIKVRFGAE
jgi:hypothetical protein